MKYVISFFNRTNKIIYIFSDKYLKYQGSPLFKEDISNVENGKIKLYRAILIHSCLTRGRWCYIRSKTIKCCHIQILKKSDNRLWYENISLEQVNIWIPQWLYFLYIHSGNHTSWSYVFSKNLEPTPWSTSKV